MRYNNITSMQRLRRIDENNRIANLEYSGKMLEELARIRRHLGQEFHKAQVAKYTALLDRYSRQ